MLHIEKRPKRNECRVSITRSEMFLFNQYVPSFLKNLSEKETPKINHTKTEPSSDT